MDNFNYNIGNKTIAVEFTGDNVDILNDPALVEYEVVEANKRIHKYGLVLNKVVFEGVSSTRSENGKDEYFIETYVKPSDFQRVRRITGYLVGTVDRFNDGKKAELNDRVKHGV